MHMATVCDALAVAVVVKMPATCVEQATVWGRIAPMSSNDSRPQKSDGTTTNGLSNRPTLDAAIKSAIHSDPSAGHARTGAVVARVGASRGINCPLTEIGSRIKTLAENEDSAIRMHGNKVCLLKNES